MRTTPPAVPLALAACGIIVAATSVATGIWAILCFVPIVNLVAIPSLIGSLLLLVHALPFAAYLLLAQTDAPKHSSSLFLPFSPARHLGLLVAVIHYAFYVITTAPAFVGAVLRTAARLWNTPDPDRAHKATWLTPWWERFAIFGIQYQQPRHGRASKLDVFKPHSVPPPNKEPSLEALSPPLSRVSSVATLPDVDPGSCSRIEMDEFPTTVWSEQLPGSPLESPGRNDPNLRPVVIFLYDIGTMGPIRPQRWMFSLLGFKLADQGYVTVVPDVTTYPDGQIEDMVADVRHVLAWVHKEIRNYGGDPANIYLCGHGLGAHLGMYTLSQDAVVHSRNRLEIHNAASHWSHMGSSDQPVQSRDIPNGLRSLRIYAPEVDIPPVRGVILLSPVADVIKQVRHEAKCWLEHVSPLRRALGSSQTRCMRHSLGHILFAARNIVEVDWLPDHVLIVHGGNDKLVPAWQAVWLADLLNGLDVPTVLRQYARLSHFDTITSLMAGLESKNTEWLLHDIRSFIAETE